MTKPIPAKRITVVQRKKQRLLKALFSTDGVSLLPFGSYSKIAKKCKVSDTYVRMVLKKDTSYWSVKIYKEALNIIKNEVKEEMEIQDRIAEIKQLNTQMEGGCHE